MPSQSNIYAEKVYSEHPISLWSLDDQLDYVSYISEENRDVSTWTASGNDVDISLSTLNIGQKFSNGLYKIVATKTELENLSEFRLLSQNIVNLGDLDDTLSTFSIGSYFYSDTEYVKSITIGYRYVEEITNQNVDVTKTFETNISKNWIYLAETFDIPNYTSNIQLIIDIKYYDSEDPQTEYTFYVNGLSLGQWSEEFQSESLGLSYKSDGSGEIIDFPTDISLDGATQAVVASAYGLQDNKGYYLATQNKIYAKNSGLPMVFGSASVTSLLYNEALPSLIVPGEGFLNSVGKYNSYTFEAWMRIDSISVEAHRIFGPLGSLDGVYVDNERIYLKISDTIKSATVTEWGRPSLVHIKYTPNNVALVMNAQEIISIDIDAEALYLPEQTDAFGRSQDWLGFYASDDVAIDVDCVGVYPYEVDKTMAKRRWVYGQNVEYPENLNSAFDGKTIAIDYPRANYTTNFVFPKNSAWSRGISENLSFANNSISSPVYSLPDVVLESGSPSTWLVDQQDCQFESDMYFRMKPNANWQDVDGYLYLDSLSFINKPVRALYGIFKSVQDVSSEEVLLKLRDKTNGNFLSITVLGNSVKYSLSYFGTETVIKSVSVATIGEMFVAGIDFKKVSSAFGQSLVSFLSNQNNLELFICGDSQHGRVFSGNIYNISISTDRNARSIGYMFGGDGIAIDKDSFLEIAYDAGSTYFGNNPDYWSALLDGGDPYSVTSDAFFAHTATYKLYAKTFFDEYRLDIATSSTWEDFVPLSNFAKYVQDGTEASYYDLDFLQFNIGHPAPGKFIEQKTKDGAWTYAELQAEYNTPVQYSYAELDNELFSGFASYGDLQKKTRTQYVYDTENLSVRTYVTFQSLSGGANTTLESYTNTERVGSNNLVKAGDEWINTKYEVIDGTVIYPPKSVNFYDLAIVVHVEMVADGILTKPVRVTTIDLTSQALDVKSPSPIGTKFGIPIYPYTKNGIYFNYKAVNPFKIYKQSTPYLFLNRSSGIELVGDFEPLVNRGLTVPLNPRASSKFSVSAMQMLFKYSKDYFPYSSTPIFEIQSKNSYIKFYLVATQPDGKRAKIYAINSETGLEENGIAFYINGKLVKSPTITVKEWAMLGISFAKKLSLDSYSGAFRLNGPIMVNHMSYYQSSGLQEKIYTAFRVWDRVKENIASESLDWTFWKGSILAGQTYSWNNVLVIGTNSFFGVSLPNIYKTYTGTNKIVFDDNSGIALSGYRFRTYRKLSQTTFTKKPS